MRLPSTFMIWIDELRRSLILSTQPLVKMISLPSGEICGFDTDSQSR